MTLLKEDIIHQQILQAAQRLFQRHGYQKVTMDDVAKAIGKGRSSLYYYYKNKDEVFDAVMDAEISDIIAEIERLVKPAITVEQKLQAFAINKITISLKRKSFFESLETGMSSDEISEYVQKRQAIKKRIRKKEVTLLSQILAQGIEKGEIPAINSKKQETIIFVFMSSLRGLHPEMYFFHDYDRVRHGIEMLVQMVMEAIKQ